MAFTWNPDAPAGNLSDMVTAADEQTVVSLDLAMPKLIVELNGVAVTESVDYTVSGVAIAFDTPLSAGDQITGRYE